MVVTPADVTAMVYAIPGFLMGVTMSYGFAVWRLPASSEHMPSEQYPNGSVEQ
ncbi:hypothetical protein Mal15_21500 [Stieleria maiorica]|uniref:Uncharacterized protein n=1 Tax=Stieleria maiorica TaxID=2795974 RepID=A0A5B9MBI7_9BACT|nr:hypothetical protein Mal15_21500 [Stieleria maiorica]